MYSFLKKKKIPKGNYFSSSLSWLSSLSLEKSLRPVLINVDSWIFWNAELNNPKVPVHARIGVRGVLEVFFFRRISLFLSDPGSIHRTG